MDGPAIVIAFVQSCISGKLGSNECGPLWHLSIILGFMLLLIGVLAVSMLRTRARAKAAKKA